MLILEGETRREVGFEDGVLVSDTGAAVPLSSDPQTGGEPTIAVDKPVAEKPAGDP
jgi:hypothetical protein